MLYYIVLNQNKKRAKGSALLRKIKNFLYSKSFMNYQIYFLFVL
ncbi:hypothetical protein LEP1GSC107_2850 [Leptospira interrogans serovar Grippotyphosa str. UI 12769]|uniref:Uncharacterized protein n=5 Tax=Leptospira interrogans TaxID=173 RepID=A0A0E2D9H6_LEPIR|nr:hypothetical protein LEP1GSC045_4327 [Leptospira interrogans serovar Pomona str. Kennewicki LC82-25]EJP16903.1 hypothetical protein LEP1GSC080_2382 [Leptospira interrogans str. FPW2026]EKN96867.1 hypothetical protein LEP1GSC014_1274 [Leptospira interrogans serovar Pomona str. Pomona]EKO25883.1 hypothetical protein LEP1GSC104_1662 [Leptospira interrogans str. UI 12621]EKO71630.1 hypothetical protein LEP1GSC069_3389 [Leptospira interrogans serovar Canicola str. Fiocruz LV133]EKO89810.1 hypoth